MKEEIEKEFGEFGEIAIKSCFICGKTIRKSNCYEFERRNQNNNKHSICLKCLLKGLYGICRDKEKINEYIELFIRTSIIEDLNNTQNQKV
jgi:hypothetical protein